MRKTFNFGKIDWNGTGRRINEVRIEIELEEKNAGQPVFSACGEVWNSKHTDCECCGQCLDELLPYFEDNALYKEIHHLWKNYHLNDLHAGTREQAAFLEEHYSELNKTQDWLYKAELELLTKYGKEKDEEGKVYGTKWYYWDIPAEDLERINNLFKQ